MWPLLALPPPIFQAWSGTQLDHTPWPGETGNLNRLWGPSGGQQGLVPPTDGMILGHVSGWSRRHQEQNVPQILGVRGAWLIPFQGQACFPGSTHLSIALKVEWDPKGRQKKPRDPKAWEAQVKVERCINPRGWKMNGSRQAGLAANKAGMVVGPGKDRQI